MKNIRERLFAATFSSGALDVIRENKLNIEINHTCISEALDEKNRLCLLDEIRNDILESGADRIILHGPFTEIYPAAIDYRARRFAMERLNDAYEVATSVGAEAMVVHSGYIPFIYFKEWQAEKSSVFWQEFMSDKAPEFRIYVENVLEDEPYMVAEMMKLISDPASESALMWVMLWLPDTALLQLKSGLRFSDRISAISIYITIWELVTLTVLSAMACLIFIVFLQLLKLAADPT